jgi:hypothetical protein
MKKSRRDIFGGAMDVREVLAALRVERDQVITVIENLERLAVSREHRRGRPPAVREQKALASAASASSIANALLV